MFRILVFFTFSALVWSRIDALDFVKEEQGLEKRPGYLVQTWHGFKHFGTAGKVLSLSLELSLKRILYCSLHWCLYCHEPKKVYMAYSWLFICSLRPSVSRISPLARYRPNTNVICLRYLENGVAPIVAKRILNVSTYSQIIVGGSNFGELLGAVTVFLAANKIHTYVII